MVTAFAELKYGWKYDLSPYIYDRQYRLFEEIVSKQDAKALKEARDYLPADVIKKLAPEFMYLAIRGKRTAEQKFLHGSLAKCEKCCLGLRAICYGAKRAFKNLFGIKEDTALRGYIRNI